jgi:hypothetical protein
MRHKLTCLLVLALVAFSYIGASGQNQAEGTWIIHPTYSMPPQKVLETDRGTVYFLTGGNLFSYDSREDENYSYHSGNKLNDSGITNIFYNYDKHYLLVCYESGNIDLLYDDGSVKNMSDIKESSVTPPLTINAVSFDGDNIYVATTFGLVKFNEPRAEVVTSGNFGKAVNALTVMGDRLVIHFENYFYYTDKNGNLRSIDEFTRLYSHNSPNEIWAVSDNEMMVNLNHTDLVIAKHTIDFENKNLERWLTFTERHSKLPTYMIHAADGKIYYEADDALFTVSDDYKEVKIADLPDELQGGKIGTYSDEKSLWSLNNRGLGHYDISSGGMTVLMDRFKPDAFSVSNVRYFFPSADGKRLYVQNSGNTVYRFGGSTVGYDVIQTGGIIDLVNGTFMDASPYPVPGKSPSAQERQRINGEYIFGPGSMAEDPNDPSSYYISTNVDGIIKITDGEYAGTYGGGVNDVVGSFDNRYIYYYVSFDRGGNMWATTDHLKYTKDPIMILPADKVKLGPDKVKKEDWITLNLRNTGYWGGQDVQMLHCKKSNITFVIQSNGELLVCDNRGTFKDLSDDRFYLWEQFIDQDGKTLKPSYLTAICEDRNGKVWIGCSEGVLEISNPANALNPNMRVTHIKVPRNDGSNLADYLLGTDLIMGITTDAANRKWIATYRSGLIVTSASGDEIIQDFTPDNSVLPTEKINCVYSDAEGSTIYVGTDLGLMTYRSDATPARDDFSQILAYPNPVKSDYRGDINITGLMENTLVKISDASGSVIYQGKSEGGRFRWNGCNAAGRRVPTGIYYVLASHGGGNDTSGSSAVVTKIMVVN